MGEDCMTLWWRQHKVDEEVSRFTKQEDDCACNFSSLSAIKTAIRPCSLSPFTATAGSMPVLASLLTVALLASINYNGCRWPLCYALLASQSSNQLWLTFLASPSAYMPPDQEMIEVLLGFEERFQKEANVCSSSIRPSLIKPPEYMPENLSKNSAWMGGAILAKVVFPQNQHVTRGDYDETGPTIVHKKCF